MSFGEKGQENTWNGEANRHKSKENIKTIAWMGMFFDEDSAFLLSLYFQSRLPSLGG